MPKRRLDIQIEQSDSVAVVSLEGALDSSNVEDFKKTLEPLCRLEHTKVLLNCEQLTYVSSMSLGLLFHYHRACEAHSSQFALFGVWERIQNILRLLGLDTVLNIYGSRDEAITGLDA
ncbi:MAG: anti-sigma factor antagonist [Spartobacteria bacterium]|nr:anti-sigma factor antagonist [Spartobacteria bacterium]